MKKFIGLGLMLMLMVAFGGCDQDSSVFEPIVGTWESSDIIGTQMVFNRDDTCVETNTLLDIVQYTKTGTWTSNDESITRKWSDDTEDVLYYSFSDHEEEMIVSSSPDGISETYKRQ